jgi:hypothetical protein
MRQQPADDLVTPSTQRAIATNIDHPTRDRTPFSTTKSGGGTRSSSDRIRTGVSSLPSVSSGAQAPMSQVGTCVTRACGSMVKRVVRSTSVPIADVSSPMMRSPAQRPGKARSSTSGGPVASCGMATVRASSGSQRRAARSRDLGDGQWGRRRCQNLPVSGTRRRVEPSARVRPHGMVQIRAQGNPRSRKVVG